MTGQEILDNTFFAFWHSFGEQFIILISFAILICITAGFIWVLTKR